MIRRFLALRAALTVAVLAIVAGPSLATVLSVTESNVLLYSGPAVSGTAGEAFASGAALYRHTDGKWYKCRSSGTALQAGSRGVGIALNAADVANGPVTVAQPGAVVTLGTGTAGVIYICGGTAGGLFPSADLAATSTAKITPIAIGVGSNRVKVINGYADGAVVP